MELFDKANPELEVSSPVSRINDTSVIRGVFKPPVEGDFTFVITGNLLIGTIQIGDRIYKTDHIGNGRLRLVELDPDRLLQLMDPRTITENTLRRGFAPAQDG